MRCYNQGVLRAYLDDALPAAERAEVALHLERCTACQRYLAELRARAAQVARAISAGAPVVDPHAALARFHATVASAAHHHDQVTPLGPPRPTGLPPAAVPATKDTSLRSRRIHMHQPNRLFAGMRRSLLTSAMVVVALVALLALPPVRAAADQLLQVFRVQRVIFMPVSQERIEQLENLEFDTTTLFVGEPEVIKAADDPVQASSVDEAVAAAGFAIAEPANLPGAPTATEYTVMDDQIVQFQVDVESARELLALLGIDDVTIPDSLGAEPIVAELPATVMARYTGSNYQVSLVQGNAPNVTLPDDVDLAQLGKAALRLYGLEPVQAEALSQQIDWSTTLVVPFPTDVGSISEVTINGAPGLLFEGDRAQGERHWALYWQHGGQFYVLEAQGSLSNAELLVLAESVR